MKLIHSAALAIALGATQSATGQDAPMVLPMVEDIQPSDGYGDSPPDILDVAFGTPREEAIAKFEAALPGLALDIYSKDYRLRDNRDNTVTFTYVQAANGRVSGDTDESINLRFTSDATGGRLWKIERTIRYPDGRYASMDALRQSLLDKYGKPTLVERYPHQNRDEITFTWEKRPIEYFPDQDVSTRSFNATNPINVNPCLLIASHGEYSDAYEYVEPGRRKGNPGWDVCIGAIKFTIFYGNNESTVSEIKIQATDYDRQMRDARHVDQLLTDMIDAKASAVTGQGAPKL